MSLSATTFAGTINEGLPWWVILLIIIGCILVAAIATVAVVYWARRHRIKQAEEHAKKSFEVITR